MTEQTNSGNNKDNDTEYRESISDSEIENSSESDKVSTELQNASVSNRNENNNDEDRSTQRKTRVNRKFIVERQEDGNTSKRSASPGKSLNFSNNNQNRTKGSVNTRKRSRLGEIELVQLVQPKRKYTKKTNNQVMNSELTASAKIVPSDPVESIQNKNNHRSVESSHSSDKTSEEQNLKMANQTVNKIDENLYTVTTPINFSDDEEMDESGDSDLEISFKVRDDNLDSEDSLDELDLETDRGRKRVKELSIPAKTSRKRSRSKSRESRRSKQEKRDQFRKKEDKEKDRIFKKYKNDPILQMMVKDMVSQQLAEFKTGGKSRDNNCGEKIDPSTPNTPRGMEAINNSYKPAECSEIKLKSPSDSTLYAPAVNRMIDRNNLLNVNNGPRMIGNEAIRSIQNESFVNEYLTNLRSDLGNQQIGEPSRAEPQPGTSGYIPPRQDTRRRSSSNGHQLMPPAAPPAPQTENTNYSQQLQIDRARAIADETVLQAERFKAAIHTNQGKDTTEASIIDRLRQLRYQDSEDDEFFHITCHIEAQIRAKIEKGEFVELEKLLQKNPTLEKPNEKRMQLVNRDGMSFFVPTNDREKIDGIRKWEQAFRIYTTIYCSANPHRAGEILQYTETIHKAASIFCWDNVARYDYVFRQLMAQKPHRSWAKIYNQMWNTTLNEPIKRFEQNNRNNNYNNNNRRKSGTKDNCCWRYNKSTCKFGKSCKFDHKCSYCGIFGHPVTNCKKKGDKNPGETQTVSKKN